MTIRQYSDIEKGWLAAAIDGEGTITLKIGAARIFITNTDRKFIDHAVSLFGTHAKVYEHQPLPPRKLKMVAVLSVQSDIRKVLIQIEPYLIIKRKLAQDMIKFCAGCKSRKGRVHESNGASKLTELKVSQMRMIYDTKKFTLEELSRLFSVSITQVHNIINNKQWATIPEVVDPVDIPDEILELQSKMALMDQLTTEDEGDDDESEDEE